MNKRLLFGALLAASVHTYGQTGCGTVETAAGTTKAASCVATSSTYVNKYKKKETYTAGQSQIAIKTVHINLVVFQKADGSGNWNTSNIARINQIFDWVNNNYTFNNTPQYPINQPITLLSDVKVRIALDNVYFVKDMTADEMYYNGPGYNTGYASTSSMKAYMDANYPASKRAMNYYITNGTYPGAAGYADPNGFHSFYRTTPPMEFDGVHDWNLAFHFAHEIAHGLGLAHTYQPGPQNCNTANADFCGDVYDPACTGSGCEVCILNSYPANNNIMGGQEANWTYKSVLQSGIMHRSLMTQNHLIGNTIRNHTTGYSTTPWEVTSNETWDFAIKMYQDLVVKPGVTLTIKCRVEFVPDAKLIIQQGGQVILDGGTLTNEWYYNQMWKGVQVWGNGNQNQFPEPNPTYQGKLSIINGGTIENAEMGVRLWKPDDWATNGGIVIANNANFINCARAVEFMTYKNTLPGNSTLEVNNVSSFTSTNFVINSNYIPTPASFQTHVSMLEVKGVAFRDCHFKNLNTGVPYAANYNKGIWSIDAGYTVGALCTATQPAGQPCPAANLLKSTFENLSTGIDAGNTSSTKTVVVDYVNFINVINGVKIEAVNNFTVTRSNFTLGSATYTGASYAMGIQANNATGYRIEENTISQLAGSPFVSYGLKITGSGTAYNRTYRNNFVGLNYGAYLDGVNRSSSDAYSGYESLCNTYNGSSIIGYVINATNTNHGVRVYQGNNSPARSSGNIFLNYNAEVAEVVNTSSWPVNYYHNNGTTIPPSVENVSLFYTATANSCATTLDGTLLIGLSDLAGQIHALQQTEEDLENNDTSAEAIAEVANQRELLQDGAIQQMMNNERSAIEDIERILAAKNNAQAIADIVEIRIDERNFDGAREVLAAFRKTDHDAGNEELLEGMENYIAFYEGVITSDRRLSELNPAELSYLREQAMQLSKTGAYARGILCFFYNECFELPVKQVTAPTPAATAANEGASLYALEVYPNPAADQLTILVEITEAMKDASITITDLRGTTVKTIALGDASSRNVIDVQALANGTYMYSVYNQGALKKSGKFIVAHD